MRHGRIVLGSGAYAYSEGLVADSANDNFSVVVFFGVRGACDGLVAGGGEGRALGWALGEVGGELFGDVGHEGDGNAEFLSRGTVLTSEFAASGAWIGKFNGEGYVVAEDAVSGGFVEPGTLRLCVGRGGRE